MKNKIILTLIFILLIGSSALAANTYYFGGKKQTLSNSTDEVQAGYYDHQSLTAVAPGLTTANIQSGVTIFGKTGTLLPGVAYSVGDTAFLSADTERCNLNPAWTMLDKFTFSGAGLPGTARFYWEYRSNVGGGQTISQWRWLKNGTTTMWSSQDGYATTYKPVTADWPVAANDYFELQAWGNGGINSYVRNAQVRALDSAVSKVTVGGSVPLYPRFRAYASSTVQATSIKIYIPSGTLQNDLMLAFFVLEGLTGPPAVTPPSGWTLVRSVISGSSTNRRAFLYKKTAGSSEPASYTFTLNLNSNITGGISSYYNVTAINAENGQLNNYPGGGTNSLTPTITTTKATTLVTFFGADGGYGGSTYNWTPPSGMTEIYDIGIWDYTNSSDYVNDVAAGSYSKTGTCNASCFSYAFIVALE